MAVKSEFDPVTSFDDWYLRRDTNPRDGSYAGTTTAPCADRVYSMFEQYKSEHAKRVEAYWKYEVMADAEVVSKKPDLPNVSSGEIAGMVRRTARNVVQHTPNVEIICEFDNDSPAGILAMHVLKSKIIHEELNSNEMQQNLFASTLSACTLGFDAVMPVLMQKADKSWAMEYDAIHYRDVFPDPGVKDARKAASLFVRRYLTKAELYRLIRSEPAGWDIAALKTLALTSPPSRQQESVAKEDKKHHTIPLGYEIVTYYTDSGDPFITFSANTKLLLRIEVNKDPLKRHPLQVLILERDPQQPFGKSQIALVYGRQEFQDLMLNGAMKLWYRNINPTLIGYGTGLNGVPNMSPGKYTNIPNPNARVEAFEVSTQTLLQFGAISQQNQGAMVSLVGAADQQMAAAANAGMSQTPQGVEAQQQMVDITTNNYQKAVEHFFSLYCSYALTVYFAEMKNIAGFKPTADTRQALIDAGMPEEKFDETGILDVDMKDMATVYHVRCVPGSLVELEDEKQLRILQGLLVPISQAMPAFKDSGDPQAAANAMQAVQYILGKSIELSGSAHSGELSGLFSGGQQSQWKQVSARSDELEQQIGGIVDQTLEANNVNSDLLLQLVDQVRLLSEANSILMEKLGVVQAPTAPPQLSIAATQ